MLKKALILTLTISICFFSNLSSQELELWGMTSIGSGNGSIFKTDSIGENMKLVYEFDNQGQTPGKNHLSMYVDGKCYGVASGGKYSKGLIFEYDPVTANYKSKFSFSGIADGSIPVGGMVLASNAKFYGMCKSGGQFNRGVIYEYDPATDLFLVVFNFDTVNSGFYPEGGLIQASNGKLYGSTSGGPSFNYASTYAGTLFEFDIASYVYTVKYIFSGANAPRPNNGSHPMGDLVESYNGMLYGTTEFGGGSTYGGGVIFKYDTTLDSLQVVHYFGTSFLSGRPTGSLTIMPNGRMYGFANTVLFEFNPQNGQYAVKYDFIATSSIGGSPVDRLTRGSNGKLYGVSKYGGANSKGFLFSYNPSDNQCIKVIDFDGINNGSGPSGGLALIPNGDLLGMTAQGGKNDVGSIFEFSSMNSNTLTRKYSFLGSSGGSKPFGSLLLASNGKFYGMTSNGGKYNKGVIFEFDPSTYVYSKKVDFNDTLGAKPSGSLMEASNGKLYGLTTGNYGYHGTLFEYDFVSESISLKQSFSTGQYCGEPKGDLTADAPTKLYGMASNYCGARGGFFHYDMVLDTMYQHNIYNLNVGRNPEGSFLQISNGLLGGFTKNGGTNNKGVFFYYNTLSNTASAILDFNGINGAHPTGSLCKTSNGKIFAMTSEGGTYGDGVLFEYSNSSVTKKVDFKQDSTGSTPYGTLMQASDGKLYGMTSDGGDYNKGLLFQYNPITTQITVKHHFNGVCGAVPYYTKLVEYDACSKANYSSISALVCNQYISPSGKIWTKTGVYNDTLSNRFYCDSIITVNLIVSTVDTTVSVQGYTLTASFIGGTYQWLDCNNNYAAIPNATQQSYTPTKSGRYAVMVMGNGCIDTSSCYAIQGLGINNSLLESEIQVYPNPTSGDIQIDLGKQYSYLKISIRNSVGSLVLQKNCNNQQMIKLNLNEPSGFYLMEIQNNIGEKRHIKLIIK